MMSAKPTDYLGQQLEIEMIRMLARHVREPFFVDVGAEKGGFASVMFDCGMRGALFEPLEGHCRILEPLAARYGSRAFPYAIDAKDGKREFFIASDAAGKDLDHFHSLDRLEGAAQFQHSRSVPVTCRSLESLAAEGVIPGAIGILKIDTEGHDLAVLRGLGGLRPELVVCEYFTDGLYAGWQEARPELAIGLMASLGYSRFVATKRLGEFEYCDASPTGFLPRQWGNLFFMADALFAAVQDALTSLLREVETRFMAQVEDIAADRVAKEAVIQGLLAR